MGRLLVLAVKYTISLIALSFFIGGKAVGTEDQDIYIVTYISNASAHAILADGTGNLLYAADQDLTSLANIGHPGNAKQYRDSPVILYSNSIKQLAANSAQIFHDKGEFDDKGVPYLAIEGAVTGMPSYNGIGEELYNPYVNKSTNKREFFRDAMDSELKHKSYKLTSKVDVIHDLQLIAQSARYVDSEILDDVDVIHLSTCMSSAKVRGGKVESIDDRCNGKGFYWIGEKVYDDFQGVPENCPVDYQPENLLLRAMIKNNIVKEYQSVPWKSPLLKPDLSHNIYKVLPERKFLHYFERVRSKFVNEKGYLLVFTYLAMQTEKYHESYMSVEDCAKAKENMEGYLKEMVDLNVDYIYGGPHCQDSKPTNLS